ncbi:MAG TPA: hypothetical protein PKA28_11910 [Methylomusa anaerophila]|uniref:Uncharacterized protein n=1 Tax=Methylomusa anaerophila TaxID=1930071 RepID=A0A348AFH1_9FIRM|nr:hypothetical protein [Methylomusa anaerophila]BBB89819.1 hypothetical protein MAMMFC1_00453 [Methylomusa anaerophila]HML89135.1 hypothetical protein [Methylomusa anaerophila]
MSVLVATKTAQALSGLPYIMLEEELSYYNQHKSWPDRPQESINIPSTPLHRQLAALCMQYPYWNDYRLLSYLQKRGQKLTLEQLRQLKNDCRLDSREAICNTLIRLADRAGLALNPQQISYIERAMPEYRDRDVSSRRAGELIVYSRLFGRGIGDIGRVYAHVFADMYSGCIIGELNQDRSVNAALQLFDAVVAPSFQNANPLVTNVMHSTQEMNDFKKCTKMEVSHKNMNWVPTRRKFGVIEKCERAVIQSGFFECAASSLTVLQSAFRHWLAQYNQAGGQPII